MLSINTAREQSLVGVVCSGVCLNMYSLYNKVLKFLEIYRYIEHITAIALSLGTDRLT